MTDKLLLQAGILRAKAETQARDVTFVEWLRGVRIEDQATQRVIPMDPWPHLIERAESWQRGTSEDILKARQEGISWLEACLSVWTGRRPTTNVLLLSHTEREAFELLRKCRFVAENHLTPVAFRRTALGMLEIEGGGTILALPSTPNAGRGFTATLVIADEAAFHEHAADNYRAYYPTIADGGQLITSSTSAGPAGWFYDRWQHSERRVFIPWNARPDRDAAWRIKTLADMGEDAFMREYPATSDEAFAASTGLALPFDYQRHVRLDHPVPLERTVLLHPRATKPGIAGIDPGGSDKTAVVILGAYRRPEALAWHQYAELYQSGGVSISDIVNFLYANNVHVAVGDFGDDSPVAEELRRSGIFTVGAKKDRGAQHSKHLDLLTHNRLTIHESCLSYMEYLSYWWDPKSPVPYATKTGEGHHFDAGQAREYPIVWAESALMRGEVPVGPEKLTIVRESASMKRRAVDVPGRVKTYR